MRLKLVKNIGAAMEAAYEKLKIPVNQLMDHKRLFFIIKLHFPRSMEI